MTWREEIIGGARLILGDCRDVLATLDPVDAVVTDPPYGIGENNRQNLSRGVSTSKWKRAQGRDYGEFQWDQAPIDAPLMAAVRAAGRWQIIFGGNYYPCPPASCWLVWDKLNSGDFADCELAWTNLPGAVRIFRHMWNGMLRASERNAPRVHPTQKPIVLMEWCLTQAGTPQTVLDPFMGAGSTGVACAHMGREFIGIEREPRYFDAACSRIAAAYAQGRLFA
jgi:DNA modification methylase